MEQAKLDQIIKERIKWVRLHNNGPAKTERGDPANLIPRTKPIDVTCSDCGLVVNGVEQKIWIWKLGERNQHWRKKCYSCNQSFDLSGPNILK